jgi:hypothetical protein
MVFHNVRMLALGVACALAAAGAFASDSSCSAQSGVSVTPVIELYTSEGCSSCPPADRWLSGFRKPPAGATVPVIEAFHVAYWDYIGWADRFASPAHTERQRQIASWNRLRSVYTPQAVLNGRDWPSWSAAGNGPPGPQKTATASISMRQLAADQFEAQVTASAQAPTTWSAYWTVTEDGHSSKVKAGENAGEYLQHDYVVRQYTPAGEYRSAPGTPQRLALRSIASSPGHLRRINIVVWDRRSGETLQALSAGC